MASGTPGAALVIGPGRALLLGAVLALWAAGCTRSIYLAAGDGAYDRGDPRGALQAYVSARKWERREMSVRERGLLRSRTARAVRALLDPEVEAGCRLAPRGTPAIGVLVPLYLAQAGRIAALSVQERQAVDRRLETCLRAAMRAAIGYGGLPIEDTAALIGVAGRIELLRRQLHLPAAPRGERFPADRAARIAMVLRDVAREALAGVFDLCAALVRADQPFLAAELGRVTARATAAEPEGMRKLAELAASSLRKKAAALRGHPALSAAYRDLAGGLAAEYGGARPIPPVRPLVAFSLGEIRAEDCDRAAAENLRWALATKVASPFHAVIDLRLRSCGGQGRRHETTEVHSEVEVRTRRVRYEHTWTGYLKTWECELGNVVQGRTCRIRRGGGPASVHCRSRTTLKKVCRPSAAPIESHGEVEQIIRHRRVHRFEREVHVGLWTYAIRGVATLSWGDRHMDVPLEVRVERRARWWSDAHGSRPEPDLDVSVVRKEAVARVVDRVHALAVTVTAEQIGRDLGAAAMSLRQGDTVDWAEHMLRAIGLGHRPEPETLDRLGALFGAPSDRFRVLKRGPGLPPRPVVRGGFVLAELIGGDVGGALDRPTAPLPAPRRDRLVENLRAIVQRPILVPGRKDSHYEVIGTIGPSPLDPRRISPHLRARARFFGWLSLGFGGDLEALGQGTRGWMTELAAGPTLSDSFARVELFGRLERERLLPRPDALGAPSSYRRREDLYLGLRATTGGPVGVWLELAGSSAILGGRANFGGEGFEAHPLSGGVILDLRVAWLRAGATWWYGENEPLCWFGALGLRL